MTLRLAAVLAATTTAVLLAVPALAQAPDFGDDSSTWANDGECDDPRFTGPGVASVTVESDAMRDASDCRAAFEAGTAQIAGDATQPAAPIAGTKGAPASAPAAPAAQEASAGIDFGDDSSEWANDGECDDRRFVGQGMASSLTWANVGQDASDCRSLHEGGAIRLWNPTEAQAATQCAAIDFGDDTGEYANDGECDDIRFEGLGSASGVGPTHTGHDAFDCLRLCAFGAVSLRDY